MRVETFASVLGADFYAGVPDSLLRPFCDYLMNTYGIDPEHHIIAANEGNCAALAAGYHLATGKVPVVYMQNSGEGNIVNPAASLLSDRVYAIPAVFVVGWRGEPGVRDEPQHAYQGLVTLRLLEDMDIKTFVVGKETTGEELRAAMDGFRALLSAGKDVAFVIRKGALEYSGKAVYKNGCSMRREEIIRHIVKASGGDPVVSTTGKASRELFETRAANGQGHEYDFLTVGSMGHSSSIALGVATFSHGRRVWCIDGDGAVLMHMGALAVIGANRPKNLVHVVINNGAHETVGGMPTVAGSVDLPAVASACGYPYAVSVDSFEALDAELGKAKARGELSFIEVKCSIGAREDLGRPTSTPIENKKSFMAYLSGTGGRPGAADAD
jgi:phosphonopyruvate decarboxylase